MHWVIYKCHLQRLLPQSNPAEEEVMAATHGGGGGGPYTARMAGELEEPA